MINYKIILLINDFSAYYTDLDLFTKDEIILNNVKILFLLKNTTSVYKSLNQEIIKT